MIAFAWIQTRAQAAIAFAAYAVLAVALLVTGIHLVHVYDANVASGDNGAVLQTYHGLQLFVDALVLVVPALVGLFWGAPLLARELETGTYRLAWTQSVSRTRWVAVKVGLATLTGVSLTGLVSLAVTWWSSPVDRVNLSPFSYFDERDVVPLAYAAFAVALGAALGVLIRRTVPAMAATLVAFVAVRISFDYWVRPNLLPMSHLSASLDQNTGMAFGTFSTVFGSGSPTLMLSPPMIPDASNVSAQVVDSAGNALTTAHLQSACPQLFTAPSGPGPGGRLGKGGIGPGPGGPLQECVSKLSSTYHMAVSYQPGSHYWPLQWIELGVYLGAAALLGGFCVWWVRRRRA